MNRQPSRRSSLFLMELILAILFFTLAAAICIRFFVKSHMLEQDSIALNHAVTSAASAAELVRSDEDPLRLLQELFPESTVEGDTGFLYYDKTWQPCSPSLAVYTLRLDLETAEGFRIGNIEVTDTDRSLYELTVQKYLGKEVFPS